MPSAVAPLVREDQVAGFGIGPLALWSVRRGFTREGNAAWTVDHAHDRRGRDVAYTPLSLFAADVALPAGTTTVMLPVAPAVLVFAATVTAGGGWASLADERTTAFDQAVP